MTHPAPLTPIARFSRLIEALMQDVAGDVPTGWLPIPFVRIMWRRLRQLNARFFSVLARFRAGSLPKAGTLPKPATPPADAPRAPKPADPAAPQPGPRPKSLPRQVGWLFRKISYAGHRREELQDLLDDPETEKLVADAPQLGRTLRPLCRMLGVAPPAWLRLPARPRRPLPPKPKKILLRLGAGQHWREGDKFWPSREQALKYDAKIWIYEHER